MDLPPFCLIGGVVIFWEGELGNEVHQGLCFDGCSGVVLNVELAEFNRPLNHSPYRLGFVNGFFNRLIRHYQDVVRLEVRSQFMQDYY